MAYLVNSRQGQYHYGYSVNIEDKQFYYEDLNNFTHTTSVNDNLDVFKIEFEENDKSLYLKCVDENNNVISKKRFKKTIVQPKEVNDVK